MLHLTDGAQPDGKDHKRGEEEKEETNIKKAVFWQSLFSNV